MPPKRKKTHRDKSSESACPDCGGSGYVVTEDGARPCHCLRSRMSERYLDRANIPPRFAAKSIETFKTERSRALGAIRDIAKAYVSGFTARTLDAAETSFNGLLFIGGVGSGKTHMAVAILRIVIERGFTGRYCNVVDLLDDLRASFQPNAPQSGQEIIDAIVDVDLLVLDDLGAEAPTGWVHDRLYQIVNRRYEESRPTIITTNLSLEELGQQVGLRITSRLCEMCQRVDFPDQDWRRKRLAEQARRG